MLKATPFIAACVAALVFSSVVHAQTARENQQFPIERLRLALDRSGIQGAEAGTVLPVFNIDAGAWFTYVDDPLVIEDANTGKRLGALVHSRLGGALMGAVGLMPRLQAGLEIPLIMFQNRSSTIPGATTGGLPRLSTFGFGDIRLVPKLQLLKMSEHDVDVSFMPSFTVPSGGSSAYRGDKSLTFTPAVALSRPAGPVRLAANLEYVLRKDVTALDQKVEDELLFRLGAAYRPPLAFNADSRLQLDAMLSGGFAAASPFARANQTPLELLLQGNYDLGPVLTFVGTGFGLQRGFGTPDWRVFFGARVGWVQETPEVTPPAAILDTDGDGIPDNVDKCPTEPEDLDGFQDEDGCPDLDNDNDGIPDAMDKCPNEPEDVDGFQDEDGCPDADNDQDGIADDKDACPNEPEDLDEFQDEDGCPDKDNDNDSLPDVINRCPNEPGPVENAGCPDSDRDGDGVVDRLDNCPDEPGPASNQGCKERQLVKLTADKIEILDRVYFKTGLAVIETRSYSLLENVAKVVLAHPEVGKVAVDGHTDDRGSAELNTKLSQDRADSVIAFLVGKGVPKERLVGKGYGPTRPIDTNKSERGRANNRRVEFNLVEAADSKAEQSGNKPTEDTSEKR